MKLLRKTWFKIVISLIGGGIIAELIHITTGDPNRPMKFNPTLIVAVILFLIISLGVYVNDLFTKKSNDDGSYE